MLLRPLSRGTLVPLLLSMVVHGIGSAVGFPAEIAAQAVVDLPENDRTLASLPMDEAFRIGGAAARGWQALGYVPTVSFDERGHLYVLDADQATVLVVDDSGGLVRRIGGRGEGPGEFASAGKLLVSRDSTVVIFDAGRQVYHAFSPRGSFVGQFNVRDITRSSVRIVAANNGPAFFTLFETDRFRTIETVALANGAALHRAVFQMWRPEDKVHRDGVEFGFSGFEAPAPFEKWFPSAKFDRLPEGGLAVVDSSSYLIRIVGPDGTVDRIIQRPIAPQPVSRSVRAETQRRTRARFATMSGPWRDLHLDAIDNMRFFPEVPVVCDMRTTWSGGIWIERCDDNMFDEARVIDVIAGDGSYVGSFAEGVAEMPAAFGPDGLVVFIRKDEFDATVVLVGRLSDPSIR